MYDIYALTFRERELILTINVKLIRFMNINVIIYKML